MRRTVWFKRIHPGESFFYKSILIVVAIAVMGIVAAPGMSHAENIPLNNSGIFSATADDGSTIYLYRYAPYTTGTPHFRTSGTPVLIFTGICMNMNQYLACTPPGMEDVYSDVFVPSVANAPEWALNTTGTDYEPYIKADKMRYYSLAHYLWLQGFDPWFANYRGAGHDPVASEGTNANGITTLDTWATQDVPAAIAKVKSVTGKRMFIGGHSTGGLVSYEYLQGAYMDYGRWTPERWKKYYYQMCYAFGYMPHVTSSASLAETRNADVKGFIGLDPAGVPWLPDLLDSSLFWGLVGSRLYLPLDSLSGELVQLLPDKKLLVGVMDTFLGLINDRAGDDDYLLGELFAYLNFWKVDDMDPCMEDFMLRYSIGGASIRGFGQYMDMGLHYTLREHYKNGSENYLTTRQGPTPDPGSDGYYYYDENVSRMTVPLIVFSSSTGALVAPEETYEFIISKKSPTAYDQWYVVNGTAHVDVAMGNRLPTAIFQQLGPWLKTIDALPANPENTDIPAERNDL
ncbi:MAG: alpha/beta hydrolase [Thermodesulfobacteriota bacterium]|nr:alpha/beta hydrolase [Thermodesulfobacteriota bacterium]